MNRGYRSRKLDHVKAVILKVIVGGLLPLLFNLSLIDAVRAHAPKVLRSEPAPDAVLEQAPAEIRIWFAEELQSQFSNLRVLDAAGNRIDTGDGGVDLNDPEHASMIARLPASLPDGLYLVRWRAVPLDNDVTIAEFTFAVGESVSVAHVADNIEPSAVETGNDLSPTNPELMGASADHQFPWHYAGVGGFVVLAFGSIWGLVRYKST